MKFRRFLPVMGLVVGLALSVSAGSCFADRIVLRSGASYEGTVVESNTMRVVFLARMGASETRLTFPRSAVRLIERSVQADDNAGGGDGEGELAEPDVRAREPDADGPGERVPEGPNVVVARLHGAFGEEILPIGLERVIDAAEARDAAYIVLDIDSDGGAVWAATRMMDMIVEAGERFRFIAVVRRGISASIWPIFSCHEVFVLPRSEVGAAVIFSAKSGEVSAKFNSAAAATLGSVAEDRGHSADVVRAMIIGSAELYAAERADGSMELSASELEGTETSGDLVRVHRLDDGDSVLTMTALEMERYGLAEMLPSADEDVVARAIRRAVGADRWEISTIDSSIMDRWAEACRRRREQTEELGTLVVEEIAAFQRLTGSGAAGALDDMLDSTTSLRRLLGRYVVSANRCHECFPDFQEKIDEEEVRETQLRIGEIQDEIRKRKRARD